MRVVFKKCNAPKDGAEVTGHDCSAVMEQMKAADLKRRESQCSIVSGWDVGCPGSTSVDVVKSGASSYVLVFGSFADMNSTIGAIHFTHRLD